MAIARANLINEVSVPRAAGTAYTEGHSEIEREVIDLFDQLRNSLFRYVLSFGLSVHDGEDVIQEVFLALFRHLRAGKSRRNLRGWIFRVGRNLAFKQYDTNRKSPDTNASDWTIAERQLDRSPNPEEQVSYTQRRLRLLAVLQTLPKGDQSCLRLRAEGLRYREIASVLGISLGAVSMSLTRSLARLMDEEGG
jgi:RNA polymerase sigma-70 factor (ECF subfamily)